MRPRKQSELEAEAKEYHQEAVRQRAKGEHQEALLFFARANNAALEAENAVLAAIVRLGEIDSLGVMGRETEAIALGETLEKVLREAGKWQEAGSARINMACVWGRQDNHVKALQNFQEAIALFSSFSNFSNPGNPLTENPAPDPRYLASAYANAANSLSYLGRLEEARNYLRQAESLFEQAGYPVLIAMCQANRGYLHYLVGEYGEALLCFQRAETQFPPASLERARLRADRADTYLALNLFPEAEEEYEATLPLFRSIPLPYETGRALLGQATALLATIGAQGNLALNLSRETTQKFFALLDEAETIFTEQGNFLHLGRVFLLRALAMSEATNQTINIDERNLSVRMAEGYFRRARQNGWAAEARFLESSTLAELQKVLRVARQWHRGWLECRVLTKMGILHRNQGNIPRALQTLRRAIAVLEDERTRLATPEEMHVAFLADKTSVYEEQINTLLLRGTPRDLKEALYILEQSRSRLVYERLSQPLMPSILSSATDPAETTRLQELRRELSEAYQALNGFPPNTNDSRRYSLDAITKESVTRATVIQRERAYREALQSSSALLHPSLSPHLSNKPVLRSYKNNFDSSKLPTETAFIAYYVSNDSVGAFVLTSGRKNARHFLLCSTSAVTQTARRLRFHLGQFRRTETKDIEDVLTTLYNLLIRPLEAALTGIKKIVFIPHGPLHGLPLHALHSGTAYLGDQFLCTFSPSLTLATWRATVKATGIESAIPTQGELLVMGVSKPELPLVEKEALMVAQSATKKTALYCGEEATRAAFFAHAGTSHQIHLATHGIFRADNPFFSGVQLADAWLLAGDLAPQSLPHCEVVTLSACQTGMSAVMPGDDTFGLVRAFLTAGARLVISSLWRADDTATYFFMEKFYDYLADQNSTHCDQTKQTEKLTEIYALALQQAGQRTREKYPHPYYWATFVPFGRA